MKAGKKGRIGEVKRKRKRQRKKECKVGNARMNEDR
jgi:hypothetical protein